MIGRKVGHYRVLERLGEGGMGVVYKAEDTKLGRLVALKFLPSDLTRDADAKTRFLREARAASLLDHPNICTIYEIGETDDGQSFIAMACYEGETLWKKIERGPIEVDEAVDLTTQVARGLAKAHASGIVHRDIKPANVIMTSDGVAKILDFGVAKLAGATRITKTKATMGTLVYMSPEQLRGDPAGPPSDVWSLGVVTFELLTGERPFRGDYEQAVAYSILNEQPLSLSEIRPDVAPELDRIVRKMLRKDPLQRYQSAGEILADIEPLRAPSSGSGRSAPRATKPREPLRSGARLGPYEIVEPLGSGGMGDVYRARDTRLDRQVAIKVLAPELCEDAVRRQRFQREAKTISSLSHPNICTLFDVGEQEGIDYLVMEYLEGETLADRLTRGPVSLNELLPIGIHIVDALGAAHRQGVIHRDLKPGNVMLTSSGAVKLVDFGLAKDIGVTSMPERAQTPDRPLTAEGTIIGTLAYMAPEQVEGREADARTDIFALGAILYEMATGRRAFEGATRASLIVSILDRTPPLLVAPARADAGGAPEIDSLAAIEPVVRQCLEKDPDLRWQSAPDVANALRGIQDHGPSRRARPRLRLRRAPAAIALIAGLALVAALVAHLWTARRPEPSATAGPPRTEVVQVTSHPGIEWFPSLSPDGKWVVYAGSSDGRRRIFLQGVGGLKPVNLTEDSTGDDDQPAFSPDGEQIAFRSSREGGGIFVMGRTGEAVRRVTREGHRPSWSPDGTQLAYTTESVDLNPQNAIGRSELWVVSASGAEPRRVLDADAVLAAWSPDGRRIAYTRRMSAPFRIDICTVPVSGGTPELITDDAFTDWSPAWSPDGLFLYFASDRGGAMNLWRIAIDPGTGKASGDPEPVTVPAPFLAHPSISADGTSIAYTSALVTANIQRLEIDPAAGEPRGDLTWVTTGSRRWSSPDPSPDGEWVAFYSLTQPEGHVYIARADGTGLRQVTGDAAVDRVPRWSPDGEWIAFFSNRSGPLELWMIRPDGSDLRQITKGGGSYLTWSNDGKRLATTRWVTESKQRVIVFDPRRPWDEQEIDLLPPMDEEGTRFLVNSWSPDGERLAGATGQAGQGIAVYTFRTRAYERLAEIGEWPVWMPDSRRILFVAGGNSFHVIDSRTRKVEKIFSVTSDVIGPPRITSDGTAYYSRRVSETDVWVATLK
jgi:eukaryotic-like serine/threonine-protein kinase